MSEFLFLSRLVRLNITLVLSAALASNAVAIAQTLPEAPLPKAQTALPALGGPEGEDLPPLEEKRIAREIRVEIARAAENLDDVEVNGYLQALTRRLSASLGAAAPYVEPYALRDPTLNAFALPGGLMGVNSGLIAAAGNENELAAVVAHEIGHIEQRHIARMIGVEKQASLWNIAALAVALLAARSNSNSAGNAVQAAVAGGQGLQLNQMLAFSRDAEREADRVGLQLLSSTGYDVSGMVGIFQRLQAQGRLYESTGPVYQRTHPLTTERIADIQNRTRMLGEKPAVDSLAFRLMQARTMVLAANTGQLREQLRQRFLARTQNAPVAGEPAPSALTRAAAHYGLALLYLQEAQAEAAEKSLNTALLTLAPTKLGHPSLVLAQARVEVLRGRLEAMQATLAKLDAFQADPALRDIVQEGRIEVLQSAQAHAQALPLLRARLVQRATEPTLGGLYKRLALSYGALGQRTEQLRAQAESLALDGAWPAAVQMLKEARAVPGNDFATSSQIDSRLREFSEQAKLDREERKKRGEPVPSGLAIDFRELF